MNYQVIIDGDNISIERYFTDILCNVQSIVKQSPLHTTIVCQSNLTFKYVSQRSIELSLRCCKTQNKNATDANILFLSGLYVAQGFDVIIVSNDKIYSEIEDNNNVTIVGYNPPQNEYTSNKLRKKTILQVLKQIKHNQGESYDVTLDDLQYYFPKYSRLEVRKYIESLKLHGIIINASDVVYINNALSTVMNKRSLLNANSVSE
jgi:predicted methyltransferase